MGSVMIKATHRFTFPGPNRMQVFKSKFGGQWVRICGRCWHGGKDGAIHEHASYEDVRKCVLLHLVREHGHATERRTDAAEPVHHHARPGGATQAVVPSAAR